MSEHKLERLELYKIFVDSSFKVSENRLKTNTFFVLINTIIIGSAGFINVSLLLLFGIFINALWSSLIKSSKNLNRAKFEVIHKMEEQLCHKCFVEEDNLCKSYNRKAFSTIEAKLPYFTSALYVSMLVYINWGRIVWVVNSLKTLVSV